MSTTNPLVKMAAQRFAKNTPLGQQQNQPSIADTDPHLLTARAEAESRRKRHWWSRKAEANIILSERDRKILRHVKSRAFYLDRGFQCCCCNIGLDGVIGLIPGIGDALGAILALELVRKAAKADLPRNILLMMFFNIAFDFVIGLVPLLGDILDFMYKANMKNATLLEEYLMTRRRDELLMEQGKLPPSFEAGTGPIPGTSSERPALKDTPRVTAYDSEEEEVETDTSSPAGLQLQNSPDPPRKSYRTFWK
ncbi:hypothetical protein BGW37DRAFT_522701 [Umbelopsis sp. PMI_123]|nr:hypothetical protein BGW37DRAFT_522701 [Umbelopsis sp. PMI_123]